MYQAQSFQVTDVFVENKFECTRNNLLLCNINTVAKHKHVLEIEWSIRTVKEHVHCTSNGLPFKCITKIMIESMVMRNVT